MTMQIDRRITNGLAWAGVVLVIGVPVADLAWGQMTGDDTTAPQQIAVIAPVAPVAPVPAPLSDRPAEPVAASVAATPEATPVQVAPAAPVQAVAVASAPVGATGSGDVVDGYLQSGRTMPSYITGAGAAPVVAPPVAAPATVAAAPAVVSPAPSAPVAASPVVTAPAAVPVAVAPIETDPLITASLAPAKVAPMPMPLSMRPEPVLIVEGPARTRSIQVESGLVPLSSASVTYDDLEDWESGPLSEFLARRQGVETVAPDYDEDGFFLDEGPNGRQRGDRLIGPVQQPFFPFVN